MDKTRIVITAVVGLLAFPGASLASPVHQYTPKHGQHCKTNYVPRNVTVKHHKHGRIVKRKERVCVYVKPKPKTVAPVVAPAVVVAATPVQAPTPSSPAPSHVALRAHLDPSFVQSPTDGLEVTYSYSAEAQRELSAQLFEDEPSLPNGVLSLYSDGLLVCSMNVGGETTEGECPVTYSTYGNHTVDTIYTSGESSATTGNETENVEPFPVTLQETWGTPAPTVNLIIKHGIQGTFTVHGNFEGATEVGIAAGPTNAPCTAPVVGDEATCVATVESRPSSVKIEYPGGQTTVSQEPDNGGTQEVTRTWPADSVEVTPSIEEWNVDVSATPTSGHIFLDPEIGHTAIEVTPQVTGSKPGDESPKGEVSIVCETFTEPGGTVVPGCGNEGKMFGHWQELGKAGATKLVFHFPGVYHFELVFHSEDPEYDDTSVSNAVTITVTET